MIAGESDFGTFFLGSCVVDISATTTATTATGGGALVGGGCW